MSTPSSRAEMVLERFERGDYLGVAEVVGLQEYKGAEMSEDKSGLEWDSRIFQHFETPIALEAVEFDGDINHGHIEVKQANFHVFGPDEMSLLVSRSNKDFVRSDPLSLDVMEAFVEAYVAHSHIICLESLRRRRMHELETRKAERHAQRVKSRKGYTVTLNGVEQPFP